MKPTDSKLILYAEATGALLACADFIRRNKPSPELQDVLNRQILEAADRYERKTR